MNVHTIAEIRALEAAHAGQPLMERAGRAAALWLAEQLRAANPLDKGTRLLVLAGPGDNGGDALVAARRWREAGGRAVVWEPLGAGPSADRRRAAARLHGVPVVRQLPSGVRKSPGREPPASVRWVGVLDGLFGIGLGRELDGPARAVIDRVNALGVPTFALDLPSGLAANTGRVLGAAVRARATLTFIGLKPGLLTGAGPGHCGRIAVAPLGLIPPPSLGQWLTPAAVRPLLPPRRHADAHKGDFGAVAVLGGAEGMVGAALLAARAALRLGAGKVVLCTPSPPGVDWAQPELLWRGAEHAARLPGLAAVVAGPGLGEGGAAHDALRDCLAVDAPLVLDADALNLLADDPGLREQLRARSGPTVLTPHPKEAGRLLGLATATVQTDRLGAARELAGRDRACVVLKGAGSVCALPDGRYAINPTGNPGMATGGSGDVLAGILGALLAQGLAPWAAIRLGVHLHGAAGDHLAARLGGHVGLSAGELIDPARELLNAWIYSAPGDA